VSDDKTRRSAAAPRQFTETVDDKQYQSGKVDAPLRSSDQSRVRLDARRLGDGALD
jgi:hypothetical protein